MGIEIFSSRKKLDSSFFCCYGDGITNETCLMVEIEITERARKYGYVFWKTHQDGDMSVLLGKRDRVDVVFMKADHGNKKIDWKNRRISVGWRWTRSLTESKKIFVLKMSKSNKLEIKCR